MKKALIEILKVVIIVGFIWWLFNKNTEDYVQEYQSQIESLESQIDSLNMSNNILKAQIDTFNIQILNLNTQLKDKTTEIQNLRYEVKQQINAVDSFTSSELEEFFAKRYDSTFTETHSQTSN